MRRSLLAAELLLASGAHALPEIHIAKRDRHTHGATKDVANGVVKRQGSIETNIFDVLTWSAGGAYYANVTVGTPAQPQTVIVDTGSSDLYFDASTAASCQSTGRHSCKGGTFDASNSNSYSVVEPSPAFNTSFGDGSTASGPFGRDTICIGDDCIDNVQFGVAAEEHTTTSYSIGLMGLGYSFIEATHHKYPNMPEVLSDAGVINSRLYSIYLNDAGATSGSVLFGGIDTSKYTGTLQTLDLIPEIQSRNVFQFITSVTAISSKVNGKSKKILGGLPAGYEAYRKGLAVLLDTGSAAWSVPQQVYPYIAQQFSYVDRQGLCPCSYADSGDSVTVTFADKIDINVDAKEFILPLYNPVTNEPETYDSGEDACIFMIAAAEEGTGQGFLTLGDAILRSMYLVYDLDQGQVSIAQANVNSTASPSIKVVQAGAGGVAKAANNVKSAPAVSGLIIAPQINATATFKVSSAKSTLGEATGTAAIPADAQVGSNSKTGASGSGSGGSQSSGVAAGLVVPGADWRGGMWVSGLVVGMAALGAGLMI